MSSVTFLFKLWNCVTCIFYKYKYVNLFTVIASRTSKKQNDDYAKGAEQDTVHLGNGVDKTENKTTQDQYV